MALSVEKLLTDAHMLIAKLKDHDSLADGIIGSSRALFNKVEAMKQYQDDITELNEIAKHRPRSTLVLGIAQENRQIRQLQQENRELEASLEEHQSALELIMQKYREHTVKLLQSNQMERALKEKEITEKSSMSHLMDKIDEMAGVMQKAIEVDETSGCVDRERLSRLEIENRALREMLEICTTSTDKIVMPDCLLKDDEEASKSEQEAEGGEEDEDGNSEADCSTLKKQYSSSKDDEDGESDSSTLKRPDGLSREKEKEDTSKKEKKDTSEPKKKTEAKKGEVSTKDSSTGATGRSGSKSPVSTKSVTDLKKPRVTVSPTKRANSTSAIAKKEPPSSIKKSPSVESKKDPKSKTSTSTKTAAKK